MKSFGGPKGIGRRTLDLGSCVISSENRGPPDKPGIEHGTFCLVGVTSLLGYKNVTLILLIYSTCALGIMTLTGHN